MVQERRAHGQVGNQALYDWFLQPSHLTILFALLMSLLVGAIISSPSQFTMDRLVGMGVIFAMLGLAWLDKRMQVQHQAVPWEKLATRLGLTCQVSKGFFDTRVSVVGSYRGRSVTLYTPRQGKGQVPLTRIEIVLENRTEASFRLRGPFSRNEVMYDQVTTDLFEASDSRQFGHDQRFFIRSKPVHLVTNLMSNKPIWSKLLQLERLTSIELDRQVLLFEQMGILQDVDQLQGHIELLSKLADSIETQSAAKAHLT